MPRTLTRIALPAALAASVIALAGCSTSADAGADDGTLQVVATTTQMGDVVREIVGDDAEVTQLLQPGQSAHSYDPTPEALTALATADVLVINGAGLEEWLDDTIEASGFDGELVDASADVHLHEGEGHDHDHGDEEHADEEHADESAEASEPAASAPADADAEAEEGHDDHDHGGTDPHVWSDPHQVVHMAETIGAALAAADTANADAIEASTADYVAQLEALDEWVHASIEQVPADQRLLVTNHDTFSYLAEATGMTVVGSVMPAFDDNAEPSAADIDALVAAIRESGVRAVFSETSIDPQIAETIASEAGVEVYSGEDALYADSLGAAGTPGATYVGSVIHNVTLIVESWGVEPLPVPDSLTE
ncbi:metal ABC transporter substrate-binding protein [Agrococcus jejuensis]|uniref:Zinc/manganese transport system substrate-binding protein n=1 Tax=Agrococcus jejuensis TaxID=399736 RepID=A0A1G8D2P2_9MICO|nr:metal ABC transporter substrate-binding protein [Agrococcus jejuensis]SDH51952.1 zinc/manganese transport system substrate-binding protein [Agrococcus jejuensis]